jgi:hypothetical protein
MQFWSIASTLLLVLCAGCGTTRWSDTQRTATEQLLLSDAIDQAVNRLDFRLLSGQKVYLDISALKVAIDSPYLASSVRQKMFAQGCVLTDKRDDADYVVEARVGALGTDHSELLFGVPATKVPEGLGVASVPTMVPEIPLVKKTEQRAVAKVALFAYNRRSGAPVWQSGAVPVESRMRDLWVLGAGPFQKGGIVDDPKSSGDQSLAGGKRVGPNSAQLSVTGEAWFSDPKQQVAACTTSKPATKSDRPEAKLEAKPAATPVAPSPLDPKQLLAGCAAPKPMTKPDKPEAKAVATSEATPVDPSPLDDVVPACYTEPTPLTSGPAEGTGGFLGQPPAAAPPSNTLQTFPSFNDLLPDLSLKWRG